MARRLWVLSCVALSLAILTAVPALAASDSATAKAILEASGVKTGLAFHLGCGRTGSAGLTAALAEQGLVVHGLALDQAACARARKAIDARNVAGRAMVECVPVKPLPYLDNLANLIVTEDLTELRKHGVTREEILRVLAPGGIVCSYTGGGWPVYGKARPAEMDDWTHPQHGADGNMVSADKVFQFPIGLKWIDGVPMNLVRWAGVRGWVVAKGRCFTLSSTELENIGLKVKPHYLVARDAWNGLPLWKINCETTDDGSYLTWENAGPLAADDARVYAVKKDKVIAADAATGKVVYTCPNAFTPYRILVSDGVLVTSCWKERDFSRATWNRFDKKNDSPSLWATWMAKGGAGAVEAYDAPTGKVKWTLPFAAETIVAADGVLYALRQKGNPPTERELVAVTLADGKERWAVSSAKFGPEADFQLNTAGAGYVVVVRRAKNQLLVFSPKDGSVLWKLPSGASPWTPVVDGALWVGGQKYDPRT
ncbi:PQQ-binding-like beta-propeller repeat protein, partial [bacterium]|nr:PQQ-binding-like beta-propeller repeat protein [bacterium]